MSATIYSDDPQATKDAIQAYEGAKAGLTAAIKNLKETPEMPDNDAAHETEWDKRRAAWKEAEKQFVAVGGNLAEYYDIDSIPDPYAGEELWKTLGA